MNLCVVGNGPSAKGRGRDIDACDVVVRIKAWWAHGAEDAGDRCDVLAWAGHDGGFQELKEPLNCEHWFLVHPERLQGMPRGDANKRVSFFSQHAQLSLIRWSTDTLWHLAFARLDRHPSSGFMTFAMAMGIIKPDVMTLFGMDSTLPDAPNYADARLPFIPRPPFPHNLLAEKREIAEIDNGTWLGEPCHTKLHWPDMPDLGA